MPASAFPVHAGLPFAGRSGGGGPGSSVAELTQNKTSVQLVNEFYVRHRGRKHIDWEQVPGAGGLSPCAWICRMHLSGGSIGDWRLPDASFQVQAATKKLAERDTCQQAWEHLVQLGMVTEATLTSTMGANAPSWEVPKRWSDSNPLVYIDVSSGGAPVGRVVLEFFADVVPQAAAMFSSLFSAGPVQGCAISHCSHGAHTSSLQLHLSPAGPGAGPEPAQEPSQGCVAAAATAAEFLLVHQRRFLLTYRPPAAAAGSQPAQAAANGTQEESLGERATAAAAAGEGAEQPEAATAVEASEEQRGSEQSPEQSSGAVPAPSAVGSLHLHVTMTPVPTLNGTHEVVGQVLKGFGALRTLQEQLTAPAGPSAQAQAPVPSCVSGCGLLPPGDLPDIAVDEEGGLPMWPEDLPDQAYDSERSEVEMRVGAATRMREAGNAAFQEGQYTAAARKYTQALRYLNLWSIRSCLPRHMDYELKQLLAQGAEKCFLNRAACHLKLNQYLQADADCRQVLAQQPNQPKALFRLGQAAKGLGRLEEAVEHFTAVMRLESGNGAVRGLLEEARQALRDRKAKEGQAYARLWASGALSGAPEAEAVQCREGPAEAMSPEQALEL